MILAIIQARMSSSRLPGKVLLDLAGRPVLHHVYNRVRAAGLIDRVMVATSDRPANEPLVRFCATQAIGCFAGSEDDVLDRFFQAAVSAGAGEGDGIVRITADCPLSDPVVIDAVVKRYMESGADYASNVQPPSFPDGLDVEVFRFTALKRAWQEAGLKSEREHVTPYIRNHPELFRHENVSHGTDFSDLRWTLDEAADYDLLQKIFQSLGETPERTGWQAVLRLLADHPEWLELNSRFRRNEGYLKSLAEDGNG